MLALKCVKVKLRAMQQARARALDLDLGLGLWLWRGVRACVRARAWGNMKTIRLTGLRGQIQPAPTSEESDTPASPRMDKET